MVQRPPLQMPKDMLMDTDERPDDEAPRARAGGIPSTGAPVPVELGVTTLPHMDGSPTPKLSERRPIGALLEAP